MASEAPFGVVSDPDGDFLVVYKWASKSGVMLFRVVGVYKTHRDALHDALIFAREWNLGDIGNVELDQLAADIAENYR